MTYNGHVVKQEKWHVFWNHRPFISQDYLEVPRFPCIIP